MGGGEIVPPSLFPRPLRPLPFSRSSLSLRVWCAWRRHADTWEGDIFYQNAKMNSLFHSPIRFNNKYTFCIPTNTLPSHAHSSDPL